VLLVFCWEPESQFNKMHLNSGPVQTPTGPFLAGPFPSALQDGPRLLAEQPPPHNSRESRHRSRQSPRVTETNQDVSAGNWDPSTGATNPSHRYRASGALKDCGVRNGFSLSASDAVQGGGRVMEGGERPALPRVQRREEMKTPGLDQTS